MWHNFLSEIKARTPLPSRNKKRIIKTSQVAIRLSAAQRHHLTQAFHRTRGNAPGIDLKTFRQCIISEEFPNMPERLWQRIFRVWKHKEATNDKCLGHLSLKELLCGVTILLDSTKKEKMKFLFLLMDTKQKGYLTYDDVAEFLRYFYDFRHSIHMETLEIEQNIDDMIAAISISDGQPTTHKEFLEQLFGPQNGTRQGRGLRWEEFKKKLRQYESINIYTWIELFAEQFRMPALIGDNNPMLKEGPAVTSPLNQSLSTFLGAETTEKQIFNKQRRHSLTLNLSSFKTSPWTSSQIDLLRKAFFELRMQHGGNIISSDILATAFSCLFPRSLIQDLYMPLNQWRREDLGLEEPGGDEGPFYVTLREFMVALVCTSANDCVDSLQIFFQLFDMEEIGMLNKRELTDLMLFTFPNTSIVSAIHSDSGLPTLDAVEQWANQVFSTAGVSPSQSDGDGRIDFFQLRSWMADRMEMYRFVRDIQILVHCSLASFPGGLRSKLTEKHFVASFYTPLQKDVDMNDPACIGLPGTQWYFIPKEWFTQWLRSLPYSFQNMSTFAASVDSEESNDTMCTCKLCVAFEKAMKKYIDDVNEKQPIPFNSPIDTSTLLVDQLPSEDECVIIPRAMWSVLTCWYSGGPLVRRQVIDWNGRLEIEYVPLKLLLYRAPKHAWPCVEKTEANTELCTLLDSIEYVHGCTVSRMLTVFEVINVLTREYTRFHAKVMGAIQIYYRPVREGHENADDWALLSATQVGTLDSLGFEGLTQVLWKESEVKPLVVEKRLPHLSVDHHSKRISSARLEYQLTGLDNVGNSCYMNSALQCLVHLPFLSEYFLSNEYLYDLNTLEGSLGMNGLLAISFAAFIQNLHVRYQEQFSDCLSLDDADCSSETLSSEKKKKRRSFTNAQTCSLTKPKSFRAIELRRAVAKFYPAFDNNFQHDAQEFLSVLLNGLSEDCNRLQQFPKPYYEVKDSMQRADSIVAEEWWTAYTHREPSIITALFSGQFKSLLACEKCKNDSARFEPFSFLQLPLKEVFSKSIVGTLFFNQGLWSDAQRSLPLRFCIDMDTSKSVEEFLTHLTSLDIWQTPEEPEPRQERKQAISTEPLAVLLKSPRPDCRDLVMAYVQNHQIIGLIARGTSLNQIETDGENGKHIAVFHLDKLEGNETPYYYNRSDMVRRNIGDGTALLNEVFLGRLDDERFCLCKSVSKGRLVKGIVEIKFIEKNAVDSVGYSSKNMQPVSIDASLDALPRGSKRCLFLFLVHRRLELVPFYFLTPSRSQLFGNPLVLRFISGTLTTRGLYERVRDYLKHLVPQTSVASIKRSSNRRTYFPVTTRQVFPSVNKPKCGSPSTSFGFELSYVILDGSACSRCSWQERCLGCVVICSDDVLVLHNHETISIDWSEEMLARYDPVHAEQVQQHQLNFVASPKRTKITPLGESLEMFRATEHVDAFCAACSKSKKEEDAAATEQLFFETRQTKSLHIWACPPILIIHLKRFKYSEDKDEWIKLDNAIDFPLDDLDLKDSLAVAENEEREAPLVGEEKKKKTRGDHSIFPTVTASRSHTKYDLYGVVNHMGASGGGHYTAFVRHQQNASQSPHWWYMDDCSVRPVTPTSIRPSRSAYLLFYVRKDVLRGSMADLFPRQHLNAQPADSVAQWTAFAKKWNLPMVPPASPYASSGPAAPSGSAGSAGPSGPAAPSAPSTTATATIAT